VHLEHRGPELLDLLARTEDHRVRGEQRPEEAIERPALVVRVVVHPGRDRRVRELQEERGAGTEQAHRVRVHPPDHRTRLEEPIGRGRDEEGSAQPHGAATVDERHIEAHDTAAYDR
jgi:16S rRNA U516 pseudouridylate synthase RsuA-like enzyme